MMRWSPLLLALFLFQCANCDNLYLNAGAVAPFAAWRFDTRLYRSTNAISGGTRQRIKGAPGWQSVYQTHAYAPTGDLIYRIPVRPWRTYTVSLLFAETHAPPGRRRFTVSVNGRVIAPALDVAKAARGRFRSLFMSARRVYTTRPVIIVKLARIPFANNPMISGIIVSGKGALARVGAEGVALPVLRRARTPTCKTARRVTGRVRGGFVLNAGGAAIPRLGAGADNLNYVIGNPGVAAKVNSVVRVGKWNRKPYFTSQRFTRSWALTYRIPVASSGRYKVRLLFAETYFNAPRRRIFNVRINGFVVAVNLDVFAEVGKNVELVRDFPNIKPYRGYIIVSLEKRNENPFVNAVFVIGPGADKLAVGGLENGLCVPAVTGKGSSPVKRPYLPKRRATTKARASPPRKGGLCKVAKRVTGRVKAGIFFTMGGPAIPKLGVGAENLNYIIGNRGSAAIGSRTVWVVRGSGRAPLYKTLRFTRSRALTYRIPVKSGQRYTVSVFHAETHFRAAKRRVFDIRINGMIVAADVDVYAAVGRNRELTQSFPNIEPIRGYINISFERNTENPFVNALMVVGQGARIGIAGLENGRCVPTPPGTISAPERGDSPVLPTLRKASAPLKTPTRSIKAIEGKCDLARSVTGRTADAFGMNAGGLPLPGMGFGAENQNYIRGDRGYTAPGSANVMVARGTGRGKLYATMRYTRKAALTYRVPVTRGRRYTIRVFFAETQAIASGQRIFDIRVNGAIVLLGLDVFSRVGARRELVLDFPRFPAPGGFISVSFVRRVGFPFVNAVKVMGKGANLVAMAGLESGRCRPPKPVQSGRCTIARTLVNGRWPERFQMNTGGGAVPEVGYGAENRNYLIGGASKIENIEEDVYVEDGTNLIYHSQRVGTVGNLVYWVPVPMSGGPFLVRTMHAETEFKGRGKRVFNVDVNGKTQYNVDLFRRVGKNKGVILTFAKVKPVRGAIKITLTRKKGDPVISAIIITGEGADEKAIGGLENGSCK